MLDAEEIDGAAIHCAGPEGAAGGHLVALVHPLGCDLRIWDGVARRLGDRARVLRHDLRGHGLSGLGDGAVSVARHAADLAALLERRADRPAVVCGLSIGGQIAMALALHRPELVCALALCDTAPRIGTAPRYRDRAARVAAGGIDAIADEQMARWFAPGFAQRRPATVALMRAMLSRQDRDGYLASVAAIRDADLTAQVGAVAAPTLCLTGAEDRSTPPHALRALAAMLPDARYVEIAGAGHMPPVEAPDATAAALLAFIETLPTPAQGRAR